MNSVTGEPVKNALVRLVPVPSREELAAGLEAIRARSLAAKSTFSGPGGEFEFVGLGKGSYQLTAQKPGFNRQETDPSSLPRRIENLISSVSGVQIKLAPLGSIEGKITDQIGDPIRTSVTVSTIQVNDGYRNIMPVRTVSTDDRGVYHVWNLAAGKYYVKATGKTGGTYMYVGESSTRNDLWESFAPAYFGGGQELSSASPIAIDAGTEARADLNLAVQPAFRIRGNLTNFAPHQTVSFTLFQNDEVVSASRSTLNGTTGAFEIYDVLPGNYVLRAQQGQKARGEISVSVSASDVNDVSVVLSPPVTVAISQQIIGDAPKRSADTDDDEGMEPGCSVALRAGRGDFAPLSGGLATRGARRGTTIADVFAGEYAVELSCFGGYPISVHSGGTDLFADPKIKIQPGVAPAPLEIALKPGGGTLKIDFDMQERSINTGALLVPAFSASTGPLPIISAGQETSSYSGLAPGDYLVYAMTNPEQQEYREPAFLHSLTGGVSVTIEDGKTSEIKLTTLAK